MKARLSNVLTVSTANASESDTDDPNCGSLRLKLVANRSMKMLDHLPPG